VANLDNDNEYSCLDRAIMCGRLALNFTRKIWLK